MRGTPVVVSAARLPARVKWPCKLMSIWPPICSSAQRVDTASIGGRADEAGVGSYANVPRAGLGPCAPPLFRFATHPNLIGC